MNTNTAKTLEPTTEKVQPTEVTWYNATAQALSNPINVTEYIGDKIVTGVVVSLCYMGIKKGLEKYQEARDFRRSSNTQEFSVKQ